MVDDEFVKINVGPVKIKNKIRGIPCYDKNKEYSVCDK